MVNETENWTLATLQKKEVVNHYKCYVALGKSNDVAIGRTALDLKLNRHDIEVVIMEAESYGI